MNFILLKVNEKGAFAPIITPSAVDQMFMAIAEEFTESERDSQKSWTTVLSGVQQRHRIEIIDG